MVKEYLTVNDINIGDYVFGLKRNKKEYISQGNFSTKIKNVFNKLYDANITNRWIRTAYATEKGEKVIEQGGKVIDIVKEFKEDAAKLSHSERVHGQYVKRK